MTNFGEAWRAYENWQPELIRTADGKWEARVYYMKVGTPGTYFHGAVADSADESVLLVTEIAAQQNEPIAQKD